MKEIHITDKQQYLDENYPLGNPPRLNEQRECLHCGKVITVGDYKVFKEDFDGQDYIFCPNAPECDGSPLDWMPVGYKSM